MAITVRLANKSQTTTVPLYSASGGGTINIRENGWLTTPNGGLVTETLQLRLEGADSAIIAATNDLDGLRRDVATWFNDPLTTESVWLETNAASENAKRSLIYEVEYYQQSAARIMPWLGESGQLSSMVIQRHPLWENVSGTVYSQGTVNLSGGVWRPTVAEGSAVGRISEFTVKGVSPYVTPLKKFWIGIKPDYGYGTSNFDPFIEMESGTAYNGGTITARSGASGGTALYVAGTAVLTSTLTKFGDVTIGDHIGSSNTDEFIGDYLVLARCKVNGGIVGLTMYYGTQLAAGISNLIAFEPIFIQNTGWQLAELGYVTMPPYGVRRSLQDDELFYTIFEIWAEQISGTSQLDIDALILIPARHMIKCEDTNTAYFGAVDLRPTTWYTFEDESTECLHFASGIVGTRPDNTFIDWYWPPGGGAVVFAGERTSSHDLDDSIAVDMTIIPRWHNFRET